MSNVLDITPHLPEAPFLDIEIPLQILTRMAQVGAISRHAHGIGALALARMQTEGQYACILTRQDFSRGAVYIDDEPAVALNNPEIHELCSALHALQYNCGIWNHNKQERVGKGKEKYNHFTEAARLADYEGMHKVLGSTTPIYFVWLPERQEEIIEHAREVISHKLNIAKWANIRTVKFPR